MALWFNRYALTDANRISIPAQTQYNVTAAVSLSMWANYQVVPVAPVVWATLCSLNDFYTLQYDVGNAQTHFSFQAVAGVTWRTVLDGLTPTAGQWYHFVGTYDQNGGSNNMCVYRNGSLANSATYTDAIVNFAGGILSIGSLGAGRYFQGILTDCRVYNRALTAAEVSTLYSSPGHDGIYNGLVGRWLLDEGYEGQGAGSQTGIIKDLSDYKNNGDTVND